MNLKEFTFTTNLALEYKDEISMRKSYASLLYLLLYPRIVKLSTTISARSLIQQIMMPLLKRRILHVLTFT